MMNMKRALMIMAALLCLATASLAGVVYDNGGPAPLREYNEMTGWVQAEDFTLGSNTNITGVTFWTLEDPTVNGFAGSIFYQIFANCAGQPCDTALASGTGANLDRTLLHTGILGVYNAYEYTFDFSTAFEAQGGATYWLGLHNGPLDNTNRSEVYWE